MASIMLKELSQYCLFVDSSALKRLKEVYWYWQWRHPKSLCYLQKTPNTGITYQPCLHEEYLPRAILCLFEQIFICESSFTCVSSLMCDFSRAIDMLTKLEQDFAGCEKSVSFLPASQLVKTLPMQSIVWKNPGTIQYIHAFISITAT